MKYDEMNDVNRKRSFDELEIFSGMLPDFNNVKLKRIDISGNRNDQKHDDLSSEKKYLFLDSGQWYLGWAGEQWFGWTLSKGSHSTQLRNVDMLFEIDLPEVEAEPLGRVQYDECSCGDWDCHICGED